MTAPGLWIVFPLFLAGISLLLRNRRVALLLVCSLTFLLALSAWWLPIETALKFGSWSIKLGASMQILGRRLTLLSSDRPLLILIYGSVFFWFAASTSIKTSRLFIPLGLAITTLLVASLAVEPFLYAALFIEIAVLLAVPLLVPPGQTPGRGILRFLIFQTLAMPFILFSGWLLAGIDANPGNLALVLQAAILLGLGFAFLLAVFPFYTWIPLLAEEASPFVIGFIFWIFPTAVLFFGLGFVDRYTWLRDSPNLQTILISVGVLMVATGGLLATFQNQLGRIMGYSVIVETGFSLLAISLIDKAGLGLFFLLFIPRILALSIWSLALSILREKVSSLTLDSLKGLGRSSPFAVSGVILANLSVAGIPLLASFPVHQAIWERFSQQSILISLWILLGSLGLFIGAIRTLAICFMAHEGSPWHIHETWMQRIFLGIGWGALVVLGLFPQWAMILWARLPAMFEHLGQ